MVVSYRSRALLFLLALLAARALGPHGVSPDSGVTVTVTSYRVGVLHGCNRTEAGGAARREDRATALGTKR
jgi:hypothetical protein